MRQYASASVTVYCRGCGNPRLLSRRQAQRAGLCKTCLYPPRDVAVKDRHRRFWFERFNDHELSHLVSGLTGRWVPVDRIAARRQALVASGSIRGGDPVASPGERTHTAAFLSPPR